MTDESIISMLKEISDNGNKKYPVTDFGGVFIFRITFFDKIHEDDCPGGQAACLGGLG